MFLGERLYKRENAKTNPYLKQTIYLCLYVKPSGTVGPFSLVMQLHDTNPCSFSKTFRGDHFDFSSVNTKNDQNIRTL